MPPVPWPLLVVDDFFFDVVFFDEEDEPLLRTALAAFDPALGLP